MQFSIAAADVGFVFIANALPYAVFSPISGILADKFVSLIYFLIIIINIILFFKMSI